MSSRFYPIMQRDNPQRRIFLPNFWMKLVKPAEPQPTNVVQFKVPMAMTNYDIKNYLEKIYKIPVMHVASDLEDGRIKRAYPRGFLVKEDDFRRAYVTLPRDIKFTFPELDCPEVESKEKKEKEDYLKTLSHSFKKSMIQSKGRHGLPNWFSL